MTLLRYIVQRLIYGVCVLFAVSFAAFVVIELPPGDFLETYIQNLAESGALLDQATIDAMRASWGLDAPFYVRYAIWMGKLFHGDMGFSFLYQAPVANLIAERLPLTLAVALLSVVLIYSIAIPVGILAAVRQYSTWDYAASLVAFIGSAVPEFLLALVLMWLMYLTFDVSIGGLFSQAYEHAPWSVGKALDFAAHLVVPVVVLSITGTAGLVRVMRAGLLDELRKQYVVTARAKGLPENKLVLKYAVRSAINPIVSSAAWLLPESISGSVIVSIVLGIPTLGPLLLQALLSQDMFLASGIVLIISALTIIGILITDVVLALIDPRIRYR